jgi:hypothetical protein
MSTTKSEPSAQTATPHGSFSTSGFTSDSIITIIGAVGPAVPWLLAKGVAIFWANVTLSSHVQIWMLPSFCVVQS